MQFMKRKILPGNSCILSPTARKWNFFLDTVLLFVYFIDLFLCLTCRYAFIPCFKTREICFELFNLNLHMSFSFSMVIFMDGEIHSC